MLKNLVQQYEDKIAQAKRFQSTSKKAVQAFMAAPTTHHQYSSKPSQQNQKLPEEQHAVYFPPTNAPKLGLKRQPSILRPSASTSRAPAFPSDGISQQPVQILRDVITNPIRSARTSMDSAIEISDKTTLQRQASTPPKSVSTIQSTIPDDTAKGVEVMRAKSIKRMSVSAKQRRFSALKSFHEKSTISEDFAASILSATDTIFFENKMKGIQKLRPSSLSEEPATLTRTTTAAPPTVTIKNEQPQLSSDKSHPTISSRGAQALFTAPECTSNLLEAAAELNKIRIDQIVIQVELRDRLKLLRESIECLNSKQQRMSVRMVAST
ncbi:hypothetical protein BJ741DRAFT_577025 [Chytriomyces cf. hyalinus JEL632]|nr:hypothetical protein BJ741DRAFT_577025 [Chytriomyces cf. hyalinus JEL632]